MTEKTAKPSIEDFVVLDKQPDKSTLPPTKFGANARIRSHTVVYAGSIVGEGFSTGHGALVRENCEIGDNVSIGSHAVVEHHVKIGNNVRIHSGAFVPEYSVLNEGAWVGPNAVLTNARYPCNRFTKQRLKGVTVGTKAKIGANATILPGLTIGENALVGAGSVVTKNVPDNAIVAGCPAKVIGNVKDLRDEVTNEPLYE